MSDKKGLTPQQRKHIDERLKAHERKITWGRDRPVMTAPDDVKKAMGIVRAWERKAEAAVQKRKDAIAAERRKVLESLYFSTAEEALAAVRKFETLE